MGRCAVGQVHIAHCFHFIFTQFWAGFFFFLLLITNSAAHCVHELCILWRPFLALYQTADAKRKRRENFSNLFPAPIKRYRFWARLCGECEFIFFITMQMCFSHLFRRYFCFVCLRFRSCHNVTRATSALHCGLHSGDERHTTREEHIFQRQFSLHISILLSIVSRRRVQSCWAVIGATVELLSLLSKCYGND